jgi:hypothetical protein
VTAGVNSTCHVASTAVCLLKSRFLTCNGITVRNSTSGKYSPMTAIFNAAFQCDTPHLLLPSLLGVLTAASSSQSPSAALHTRKLFSPNSRVRCKGQKLHLFLPEPSVSSSQQAVFHKHVYHRPQLCSPGKYSAMTAGYDATSGFTVTPSGCRPALDMSTPT